VRCAFDAQDLSPLDPLRYFYDNFTSTALLSTDDYDGAIAYGRRSMRATRSHGPTLRVLAIALALDGRIDEARDVATALLQLEPAFTASQFADRYPGVQVSRTARYADALRLAGVPP
jgi:tetratricopeptide (TPR) repeat protein